jgi:HlyD family secretion protein
MAKRTISVSLAILLPLCACGGRTSAPEYEFQALRRGSIVKTVSSTGALKPVATVNVLSQISGKADQVLADYNDEVKKGDVLVILNTDTLRLQRDQLQAQVKKARSSYELQIVNYQNQEKLAERNLISPYELRQNRNQMEAQEADLAIAEANLRVIETEINQYAFITSPIDGTVLTRNINEGETVVEGSSANSSAIFVIAENLREMRIESWVGELDINAIYQGQEVRFSLEALPGRSFSGSVSSKRLSPSTQDGVVSYNVIIAVDNADLSLLPGMTCNVEFIEDFREDVLLVSNAALRYVPSSLSAARAEALVNAKRSAALETPGAGADRWDGEAGEATGAEGAAGGLRAAGPATGAAGREAGGRNQGAGRGARGTASWGGMPGFPGFPGGARTGRGDPAARPPQGPQLKPLWFINGEGALDCLVVRPGISDGSVTEVSSPELTEDLIAALQFIVRERIRP